MPALLITMSMRPNASTAVVTIDSAAAGSETSAVLAAAEPPDALVSSTTCWATSVLVSAEAPYLSWSLEHPMSLTTTAEPRRARSSANSRPSPRPAPVMTATRPSKRSRLSRGSVGTCLLLKFRRSGGGRSLQLDHQGFLLGVVLVPVLPAL